MQGKGRGRGFCYRVGLHVVVVVWYSRDAMEARQRWRGGRHA